MKTDKFLIAIVTGIIALVVVAIAVVLLRAPQSEEYLDTGTPDAVVHDYFLAIQRQDYENAYGYLPDDLSNKPDLDDFIREMNNARNQEAALSLGETRIGDVHTQVDVTITTYRRDGILESSSYSNRHTVFLRATGDGSTWTIIEFPYPYWGYNWDEEE